MTVTSFDVAVGLGRSLSEGEIPQVDLWISEALLLIKTRLGDPALLDQDVVDYVVRNAVIERSRNPDGADEETESIDDYSHTRKWSARRVTIWPEWWEMLSPTLGAGVFSARPQFEPDTARSPRSVGEGVYPTTTDGWQSL